MQIFIYNRIKKTNMIINLSKKEINRIIVHKKRLLTNVFSQGTGLLFRRKLKDKGYVFVFRKEHIIGITMIFVFFSIDVLFLDKEKRVVEVVEGLKPFKNYWPKKKAKYVVELPKNTVKEKEINVGDRLQF